MRWKNYLKFKFGELYLEKRYILTQKVVLHNVFLRHSV